MSTWTLGKKLAVSASASVAATLLLGAVSVVSSHSLGRAIEQAYGRDAALLAYSHEIQIYLQMIAAELQTATLSKLAGNGEGARKGLQQAVWARTKLDEVITATKPMLVNGQERSAVAALEAHLARWEQVERPIVAALNANQKEEALRLFNTQAAAAARQGVATLELLEEAIDADNAASANEAQSLAGSVFWISLLLACAGLAAAMASGWAGRSATSHLRAIIGELTTSAAEVEGMSRQVSQSAQGLADGVSGQAASLEETSASAEEMNAVTQQNAERCRQAGALATEAQKGFEYTNNALAKMVDAMAGITSSSDEIAKIIKVIDEIAFQTNILALNAAVEAARAGEAGMGFAVVADEVRNLAQRSAQAAKDTSALIEDSIAKAGEGKARLDRMAASVRTVTGQSTRVSQLVNEISQGSGEQETGIRQMATAVSHLQHSTQDTSAFAEESSAAAQQLSGQSASLRRIADEMTALVG